VLLLQPLFVVLYGAGVVETTAAIDRRALPHGNGEETTEAVILKIDTAVDRRRNLSHITIISWLYIIMGVVIL
jgi:hypothetical protein